MVSVNRVDSDENLSFKSIFEGQQHRIFTDTFNSMKIENFRFPPLKESEAMFENSDIAPEWRDDKECFRCRQVFTTFTRKVKTETKRKSKKRIRELSFSHFSIIVELVAIFFVTNVRQNNVPFRNSE